MTDTMELLSGLRTATGIDVHPFVDGRPLILGGVTIPHNKGLEGHSDADVIAHAVTDAVLGVAGAGDIGSLFPSDDPALKGADSMKLLKEAWDKVRQGGVQLLNIDIVVVAQEPKLAWHRDDIQVSIADALSLAHNRVAVRATTTDHLGFVGRAEGIACLATCLAVHI